ncbi:MAG: DUF1501 domain-containing protein, partial [Proteobacteria bacterium]|nr:DUF1501 domain-containing protein [Pseudomonadota bacterium]
MTLSRRTLLTSASAGAVLPAFAPGIRAAFAAEPSNTRDILVVVFLRFGCDGLSMVAPAQDPDYQARRPTIKVAASGQNAGLPLGPLDGVPFYLHPSAPELKALFDAGRLAVVHAAGLPTDTRSHFESQNMMERGVTEGDAPILGGWLARHLAARNLMRADLAAVSSAPDIHTPLQGLRGVAAIPDVRDFNVPGGDYNLNVIEILNAGNAPQAASARATVDMVRSVQGSLGRLPAGGVAYPAGGFAVSLRSVADIIKMNVGLEVATVDFGGWDHHYNMNSYFPPAASHLSQSLAAFWADLATVQHRLTVVTMTEFGRRLDENTAGGTDHGAGSFMFVLGGGVDGG